MSYFSDITAMLLIVYMIIQAAFNFITHKRITRLEENDKVSIFLRKITGDFGGDTNGKR
jgi:hypothetical protein